MVPALPFFSAAASLAPASTMRREASRSDSVHSLAVSVRKSSCRPRRRKESKMTR